MKNLFFFFFENYNMLPLPSTKFNIFGIQFLYQNSYYIHDN